MRFFNQVIENAGNLFFHLLNLNQFGIRFRFVFLELINFLLGFDQCLQKLWNLSTLQIVVHLRELIELELLQVIILLVVLSINNDVCIAFKEIFEEIKFQLDLRHKFVLGKERQGIMKFLDLLIFTKDFGEERSILLSILDVILGD